MPSVLVVEDSKLFAGLLTQRIEQELGIDVISVPDMAGARQAVTERRDDIFLSILDLTLPDATETDIVDYTRSEKIPTIVFTGTFDEDMRDKIFAMDVIDYVTKDTPASVDYLMSLVKRVHRNRTMKALVVDDSKTTRLVIRRLLELYQLEVLEAANGIDALAVLEEHASKSGNGVSLVISDFHMPEMNGDALIRWVRRQWPRDELAIIGVSTQGDNNLSAQFIKAGANDFLVKPFAQEEFFCRIGHSLDNLDQLHALREAATRDHLTGMYNRRFFFETAKPLFASAKRREADLMVAMVDIDFFKSVNDTYGHETGDQVLKAVAEVLDTSVRDTDIIARFGGEEFCLIAPEMKPDAIDTYLEKVRARIAALSFTSGDQIFTITASLGATQTIPDTLDTMIATADQNLYEAKEGGRDRVVTG
jgi:diguanylate cyclase (GGDEF)-like protein